LFAINFLLAFDSYPTKIKSEVNGKKREKVEKRRVPTWGREAQGDHQDQDFDHGGIRCAFLCLG
jgi:hypothetical protein